MKIEGQVRIPSGCAIATVISKDGNKMSGEMITNSMKPMHDRSNGLGGGFAAYGIYPEYKDFYALHMFFDSRATRKDCEAFLKERFEIVQSEIIPTRKIPAITDEPITWRYFVSPLKSILASMQLDEKEFVARTIMKINTKCPVHMSFPAAKTWELSRLSASLRMLVSSINWKNMKDTHGLHTDVILLTLPAGGAVLILLRCLTILSYITEKDLPMMLIADLLKYSATSVPFRRIQRL